MRPRRPEQHLPRRGFTLLELLAALTCVGLVLAGASHMLVQLADARDRLHARDLDAAERANGERLLRSVAYRAEASGDSTLRFTGSVSQAGFSSSCTVPGGWLEQCRVILSLFQEGDTTTMLLGVDGSPAIRVWRHEGRAELRFRDAAATTDVWRSRWDSELITPSAIGVLAGADTVVLLVGSHL